jgi:uncharacterized RDD family membrane protein YckC
MNQMQFAGFWRRAFAFGIDKAILQVFCIVLFAAALMVRGEDHSFWNASDMDLPGAMVNVAMVVAYYMMSVILDMVYFTWFHGVAGRTPGKMMFGVRVVQATGDSLSFGLAFLRWVGYIISKLPLYLGFLWIGFDRRKQGWHDKIAGTVVIRDKKDDFVKSIKNCEFGTAS